MKTPYSIPASSVTPTQSTSLSEFVSILQSASNLLPLVSSAAFSANILRKSTGICSSTISLNTPGLSHSSTASASSAIAARSKGLSMQSCQQGAQSGQGDMLGYCHQMNFGIGGGSGSEMSSMIPSSMAQNFTRFPGMPMAAYSRSSNTPTMNDPSTLEPSSLTPSHQTLTIESRPPVAGMSVRQSSELEAAR